MCRCLGGLHLGGSRHFPARHLDVVRIFAGVLGPFVGSCVRVEHLNEPLSGICVLVAGLIKFLVSRRIGGRCRLRYLDIGEKVFLFASSQFVVRRGVWTVDSWTSYSNRLGGRAAQGAHLTHWNAPAGISDELRECTPDVLIGRGFFRARCAGLP